MDAQEKNPTNNPFGFTPGFISLTETEPKPKPKQNPLLPVTYYLLNSPPSPTGLLKHSGQVHHHSFSKLRGHA